VQLQLSSDSFAYWELEELYEHLISMPGARGLAASDVVQLLRAAVQHDRPYSIQHLALLPAVDVINSKEWEAVFSTLCARSTSACSSCAA
jgi:hypothetical protein